MTKKVVLVIIDGYGISEKEEYNAIKAANIKWMPYLTLKYPSVNLSAHGESLGLPKHQIGNSEVGHLTIGCGRVIEQSIIKIQNNLKDRIKRIGSCKRIHLIGLCSSGGVHSHINHLIILLSNLKEEDFKEIYIHCITDGRDTKPKYFLKDLEKIKPFLSDRIKFATVSGRYYSMDRDRNWDRIEDALDVMVDRNQEINVSMNRSHSTKI